jgi:ribose/xylose/arabinose/galactoside ABC-type transport system permease subunit
MRRRWAARIREKARKAHAPIGLYLGLSFVILVLFLFLPQFRTPLNLSNLLLRSIPLLAVAAGQTFVLIGAGIDLSVGSVISLSTCVASVTMEHNLILGIILTLASGMAVGLANGIGVTKLRINPFLMTLGTTIIVSGISLLIRPYPGGTIPQVFIDFMLGSVGGVPVICIRKSRYGRHLYATGGNLDAAKLAGVRINAVLIASYIISGFAAAFAGLYMTARITSGDPQTGSPFQMQSIAAAVLGGTALTGGRGGIFGTVIGVVILVMLGNVFNLLDINLYWQQVLRGLILILVVGFSQFRALTRSRTVLGASQSAQGTGERR